MRSLGIALAALSGLTAGGLILYLLIVLAFQLGDVYARVLLGALATYALGAGLIVIGTLTNRKHR